MDGRDGPTRHLVARFPGQLADQEKPPAEPSYTKGRMFPFFNSARTQLAIPRL